MSGVAHRRGPPAVPAAFVQAKGQAPRRPVVPAAIVQARGQAPRGPAVPAAIVQAKANVPREPMVPAAIVQAKGQAPRRPAVPAAIVQRRVLSGAAAVQRAVRAGGVHVGQADVVQRGLLDWVTGGAEWLLDQTVGRLIRGAIGPYEDDEGNMHFLGDHEIYNIEEREDEQLKRDHYDQWATMHFNAAVNDWNTNSPASAYSFVSTKGFKAWQYTWTGQWAVRDGLLRPCKLRAHVHHYVDVERSWRGNRDYIVERVSKVKGNFWVQGIDNRQGNTPGAVVLNAPGLPANWATDYANFRNNVSPDVYRNNFFSHGVW